MKKFNLLIIVIAFALFNQVLKAQESTGEFKPQGTMIATTFLDYGVIDKSGSDAKRGFNLGRAFLGYNYKFAPNWEAQLVLDGASYQSPNSDGTNSINTYVRNAFVSYKQTDYRLTFGVLGLLEFNLQENYWGFRYVEKSFQDLNNMGPSVDLGATFEYQISPKLKLDAMFTNGDGIRKIQRSNSARYALGATLEPVKGLVFRAYGDMYNKSQMVMDQWSNSLIKGGNVASDTIAKVLDRSNKFITAFFVGYKNNRFSAGAEYNQVYNYALVKGLNYHGFSFYSAVKLKDKYRLYGRYDITRSSKVANVSDTWNKSNDGDYAILGLEYQPQQRLKLSPNIRTSSKGNSGKFDKQFFLSVEFKL